MTAGLRYPIPACLSSITVTKDKKKNARWSIWRFLFCLLLADLGAEGHEAKLGELEVLLAEGNAYDGDAVDDADDAFNDGEFEAAE